MIKKLLTVLVLFLLSGAFSLHGAAPWKKHYTKKGITVSSREVHLSDYREFMGTGIIKAPLEVVIAVLQDVKAMPRWMPDCRGVKMLRQEDKNSAVTRVIIDFPMPLTDRYMIVHSRGSIDAKRPLVHIRMQSINERGGEGSKAVSYTHLTLPTN